MVEESVSHINGIVERRTFSLHDTKPFITIWNCTVQVSNRDPMHSEAAEGIVTHRRPYSFRGCKAGTFLHHHVVDKTCSGTRPNAAAMHVERLIRTP